MKNDEMPLMVSIRCTAYNHEPYIRQCLDGIVMQHTNFRFEAIVHDDASTDGTANIIREYAERYPDIIKPIYEVENQWSKGRLALRKIVDSACKGKYIANCECDDYWTDPLKLQKQVDFLEANPEYSMCFHAVNHVENGRIVGNDRHFERDCDVKPNIIIHEGGLYCPFCSMVYRREYMDDWPRFRQIADVGDGPLAILLSLRGKVRYFTAIMGCYRIMSSGSWSEMNNKNSEKFYKHYLTGHKWYKELDEYTGGVYRDDIYHRICMTSVTLYKNGVISKNELLKNFSHLSLGKDKIHHCFTFLICEYPFIYNCGHFIMNNIRRIKIWQKKKN